ncbi:MAG TPA: YggS family pyridoxal phosphate-dependent enzyme [Alphaproteobacteria bacterium]|nr:YggS family pyridoxal phosphate-dependent enzyme [Alphaproteobacteria bacterium]
MDKLAQVKSEIAKAAEYCGRKADDVTLVAVSKTRPADEILPLLRAGHRVFGENRVQEAAEKFPALRERYPDLKLHLIGGLQTNKVREAVALFDVIESVDRVELAEKLAAEMKRQGRDLPCFVQVNTGEEPQKGGVSPRGAVALVDRCRKLGLNVVGLMCIPPADDEPSPHFAFLKKLARQAGVRELSMGMSADYPLAVQQGATFVRVGTALFGARDYSKK